ncbi:rootletin-like protein, partial [Dinothrombium tinctorium]
SEGVHEDNTGNDAISAEAKKDDNQMNISRESDLDYSSRNKDETDANTKKPFHSHDMSDKLLQQFENAAHANIELGKDIEKLIKDWQSAQTVVEHYCLCESSSSCKELNKKYEELISLKVQSNAERNELLDKIRDLSAQNERKKQILDEKERIIYNLNEKLDSNKSSYVNKNIPNCNEELMYKVLTEIGQLIVQEADYHTSDETWNALQRNSGMAKLKESTFSNLSGLNENFITPDLFDSILIALRSLLGRRRIEIEDLKGKLSASKEQVKVQKRFIDDTSEERQKLLKINSQLTNQLSDLSRDLIFQSSSTSNVGNNTSDEKMSSSFIDQVKATLKEQIDALNEENDKLHQLANDFRKSREVMEDELEDMKSKERKYKWEVEQKARDLFRIETQLETSRKELMSLKEEIAILKAENEFLVKAKDELNRRVKDSETLKSNVENELTFYKTSEISLRSCLTSEQQQNEELIVERDRLRQEMNFLKEKNLKVMSEKLSLESKIGQMESDMLLLKKEIEDLTKSKTELETALKFAEENELKQKQEYEKLRGEMNESIKVLNSEFSDLNKKLNEMVSENERINREKKEIRNKYEDLRRDKICSDREATQFRNQISIHIEEKQHLEQQICHLKSKKEEIEKQVEAANLTIKDLQSELENFKSHLSRIKVENEELHKVKISLANKMNTLQKEYEIKLAQERESHEKDLENLRYELNLEKTSADAKTEEIINQLKLEKERQTNENQEITSKLKTELQLLEQEFAERVSVLEREKLNLEILNQREKKSLLQKIEEKETALKHKNIENDEIAQKWKELCENLNQIKAENEEKQKLLEKEVEKYKEAVQESSKKILKLNNEKNLTLEENSALVFQLRQKEEELLKLERVIEEINKNYEQMKIKNDEQGLIILDLKRSMESMEKENDLKNENLRLLQNKLSSKEHENSTLAQTIDNYERKLLEGEKTRADLIKDITELRNTLLEVEKSRLELKKHINENNLNQKSLENELKAKNAVIEELTLMLEKKSEKENHRQEEINKLNNLIIELDAEKQTIKTEMINVRHKLNDIEHLLNLEKTTSLKQGEEIKRLISEKSDLELKLADNEKDNYTLKKAISGYEQKINLLELNVRQLTKTKSDAEESLSKMTSILRQLLKKGISMVSSDGEPNLTQSYLESTFLNADTFQNSLYNMISKLETIVKERNELKLKQDTYYSNLQENNTHLKLKLERLENEVKDKEKENNTLTKYIDEFKSQIERHSEALEKFKSEKKYLCGRMAQLCTQIEKLEKEKKKLTRELQALHSEKSLNDKESMELRNATEMKVKRLESAKSALEEKISDLMKKIDQSNNESESLKQECKMLKKTIKELQNNNLKLHSALSDSNLALKRTSEEEQELKRKIHNMSENMDEKESISRDVFLQLNDLKRKVHDLTSERTFLQQTLDSNR